MQFDRLKRREFITLLGGAAAAWPLSARAQKPAMRVIGFLGGADPSGYAVLLDALRAGLRDHGYIEGQNLRIEYRWAQGQYERLPAFAAELVSRKVDVIITQGTPAALVAKQATTTIPIVMAIVGDPVARSRGKLLPAGGQHYRLIFFLSRDQCEAAGIHEEPDARPQACRCPHEPG